MDRDPATYNEASETPDMTEIDSPAEILAEKIQAGVKGKHLKSMSEFCLAAATVAVSSVTHTQDQTKAREVITRVLATIYDQPAERAAMYAECYDVAFGLGIQQGATQTLIAERYGVKRATVSRICVKMVDEFAPLGIVPGPGMKSERARIVYSKRQKGKTREPARPWKFAGALKAAIQPKIATP